jgi:two-component system, chemotaxis family, protein-glutamate methylesterase/glutaminase
MPLTVLVVDDSALMRKALKRILADAGFEVHTARNGLDALDQIQRVRPDVVTLDVNMPEMDGLTCLGQIMQRHPCPVVMVSSLTDRNALATLEALELGAVDYVAKPGGTVSLNIDDVATELVAKTRGAASARVNRVAGLRDRVAAQRRQPPPPTTAVQRQVVDLVMVGSSTGGPPLLSQLLPALPASFGAPVVVAQHIPASFTAALATRLDQACRLRVHEVTRTMPMTRGNIYIARGSADVVVARRGTALVVQSVPASDDYRWHPSVDRLVASAHRNLDADRMVCVLLTGMGNDGAAEMAAVKAAGGRTIAESEDTAVVWGMPGELATRGGATVVLPGPSIADQLINWVR